MESVTAMTQDGFSGCSRCSGSGFMGQRRHESNADSWTLARTSSTSRPVGLREETSSCHQEKASWIGHEPCDGGVSKCRSIVAGYDRSTWVESALVSCVFGYRIQLSAGGLDHGRVNPLGHKQL